MALTETLVRPSLHEALVERLRNLIIEDRLKPGEKVPEKALCESLGVSRTPLREALKVLASEGFVVLHANRGARVTEITPEELREAFEVMASLEQLAGELACERLDATEKRWIEDRHQTMVKAFNSGDRKTYFLANQDIHQAIVRGSRNEILGAHHKLLAARVQRARFVANLSDERWSQAIEEHEEMLKMLNTGDAAGLGRIMKLHINNKYKALLRALDKDDAS